MPDGECCVEKKSTQQVLEEHQLKKKSTKSRLRCTNRDWEAPILAEECQNAGYGVQIKVDERPSWQRSTDGDPVMLRSREVQNIELGGMQYGMEYSSDNPD